MTEELVEKVARAISASKQSNGNTDAVVAQYVETFWRDYIPEARIAVEALTPAPAPAHQDRCRRVARRDAMSKKTETVPAGDAEEQTERYHKRPFTSFAGRDEKRRKQIVSLPMDVLLAIVRERLGYLTPSSDLDAVAQNTACEIERAMGVFPNLEAALTASSPPAQAATGAVEVRKLEWTEYNWGCIADGGRYRIEDNGLNWTEDRYWLFVNVGLPESRKTKYAFLDEARAAAQADYEQRTRSALTAAPAPETATPKDDGSEIAGRVQRSVTAGAGSAKNTVSLSEDQRAEEATIAKLRARVAKLENLFGRVEPHIDAIVCYASTMGEHEPNRIAHEVRAVKGRTQNGATETGWLIELKGSTPSWATVNPNDPDHHLTADSAKAIRFARKADAQACIDWIGWTEAFPSEHIWDDGRARSTLAGGE